jgi:hypothetical protein
MKKYLYPLAALALTGCGEKTVTVITLGDIIGLSFAGLVFACIGLFILWLWIEDKISARKKPKPTPEDDSPVTVVRLRADDKCACNCGDTCPLGRVGSALRCSKQELEAAGYGVTNKRLT